MRVLLFPKRMLLTRRRGLKSVNLGDVPKRRSRSGQRRGTAHGEPLTILAAGWDSLTTRFKMPFGARPTTKRLNTSYTTAGLSLRRWHR